MLPDLLHDAPGDRPQILLAACEEHVPAARARKELQIVNRQVLPLLLGEPIEGGVLHADRIDRRRHLLQDLCHLHGCDLACVVHAVREKHDRALAVLAGQHLRGGGRHRVEEGRPATRFQRLQGLQQSVGIGGEVDQQPHLLLRKGEQGEVVARALQLQDPADRSLRGAQLVRELHAPGRVHEEREGDRSVVVSLERVDVHAHPVGSDLEVLFREPLDEAPLLVENEHREQDVLAPGRRRKGRQLLRRSGRLLRRSAAGQERENQGQGQAPHQRLH